MPNTRRFIGFDLGAESGRCIVATLDRGTVALTEVHRFPTHTMQDATGLHWDILAITREIVEGLTRATQAFGPDFDGVAADTWGVDYVLVDSEGQVLGHPFHYRDSRTDGVMEQAFAVVSKERLYAITGTQFAQFNTVFQLLAERQRNASLLGVADTMLMMPDYLNFFLSGVKRAEYTIASTTGLADPTSRTWSWDLIDTFGMPRKIFPQMTEPGTILGPLRPELAQRTGLNPRTPVIASAGHDTASAVASVPAVGESWAYLSSGTWSLLGVELREPVLSGAAMKRNFTNEGGVRGTTRFLKNIIGLWPVQECRRFWLEHGREYTYPQLSELARQEGCVGAWVDLNDPRFLKPGEMPLKISSYLRETGQSVKESAGFTIGVVLESLAFSYRIAVRDLEHVTGRKIERLHAVGGGIQNVLLAQLTADATGLPVYAGPVEGTIVGNIGIQAVATGAVADAAAWRTVVADSFGLQIYMPVHSEYFMNNERRYREILRDSRESHRSA
jgi:rhamnulokinase